MFLFQVLRDFIETIDNMKTTIEKLKKYVRKVSKSSVSRDIFIEIQNEESMPNRMLQKVSFSLFFENFFFSGDRSSLVEYVSHVKIICYK